MTSRAPPLAFLMYFARCCFCLAFDWRCPKQWHALPRPGPLSIFSPPNRSFNLAPTPFTRRSCRDACAQKRMAVAHFMPSVCVLPPRVRCAPVPALLGVPHPGLGENGATSAGAEPPTRIRPIPRADEGLIGGQPFRAPSPSSVRACCVDATFDFFTLLERERDRLTFAKLSCQ